MRAGIALGSNLGDRLAHLQKARDLVLNIPSVEKPMLVSKVYETEPIGTDPDAGSFLNAAIEVEYSGQPIELLDGLQEIESAMGRPSKRPRNAPRSIDLDILYIGNLVLSNDDVVIPHPRLHLRSFVLTPLNDIRPELILPQHDAPVSALLAKLKDPGTVDLFLEAWT